MLTGGRSLAEVGDPRFRSSRPGTNQPRRWHYSAGRPGVRSIASLGSLGCLSWFLRRWKATAQPPARRHLTPTRPSGYALSKARKRSEKQPRLRLHAMLLRIARSEVRRRSGHLQIAGPELDDVAHQAAADAMVAILAKAGEFRGESRFTTWAYKFVIFEVSTKIGRHFWRNRTVAMDDEDWSRLPDRFGLDPAHEAEWRDVVTALHQAVDDDLTDRQRQIFVAIVLNGASARCVGCRVGLQPQRHL